MMKKLLLAGAIASTISLSASAAETTPPQRVWAADDGFCFWSFGMGPNQEKTHFAANEKGGVATFNNGYYNAYNYYEPATGKWTGFGYANYTRTDYKGPEDVMLCCNPYFQGATYGVACLDESLGPILMVPSSYMNLIHEDTMFTNTAWVKKCILEGDGINGPFEHGDKCGVRIYAFIGSDPNNPASGRWIDEPIELVLADFTDEDESKWFIASNWRGCSVRFRDPSNNIPYTDISAYRFEFFSTKTHNGKITTPPYFCLACFKIDEYIHTSFINSHPHAFGRVPEVSKLAFDGAAISYQDFTDLNASDGEISYEAIPEEYASAADFQQDKVIVRYDLEDNKYIRPLKFTLIATQNGFPYEYSCEVTTPITTLPSVTDYAYEGQEIPYSQLMPLNPNNGPIYYEVKPSYASSAKVCEFNEDNMIAHFRVSDDYGPLTIYFDLTAYQNSKIYTMSCALKWAYGGSQSVTTIDDTSTIDYAIYSTNGVLVYKGTEKPTLTSGIYIVVRNTENGPKASLESF